ncbi:MAG: beta-lactamase family protein [Bacteroidetes bacterium]|nr:MAG: beta-lactamase family protein [Bacteroidota bacterium]
MSRLPVLLIVIIALLLSSCGSTAPLSVPERIDAVMAPFAAPDAPGASVLVLKGDSVLFKKAYGLADVAARTPATTLTNYRLASVTKQFTAASVLMLAERNLLSLDDRLTSFFPGFPGYGAGITVRHLLTHTSGLVDYESLLPDTQTVQVLDEDCLQLMSRTDSLYFAPGTKYQYSNTGYALLALIVERVSGRRFADFVKENIFAPAGMTTSVAFENGRSSVANRAYGHSLQNGAWVQTDQSSTSAVLGDGGIYSNVEEMAQWVSSLWTNRFLTPAMQTAAWSSAVLNDGTPVDYGMGWHLETYRGMRHPHHGGSTRGFRNHILLFPDQRLMVIVLTNRNEGNPITEAKSIADLFLEP